MNDQHPLSAASTLALLLLALGTAGAQAASHPDAEVASETTEITVNADGSATVSTSRAIRILEPAGLAEATLAIPVYPGTTVVSVQGSTVLPNGQTIPLPADGVLERPLLDAAISRETKLLQVSFPEATVGSTVRINWVRKLRSLVYLEDWTFRDRLPIRNSRFTVTVPEGTRMRWQSWNGDPRPVETRDNGATTWVFAVSEQPALAQEPHAPPPSRMRGVLRLAIGAVPPEWGAVASFYRGLAEGRYNLDPEIASEMRDLAKKTQDKRRLVGLLYARLQRFRYVQVYLGMGGYQPHAAMWTWKRRYGDCKDLATVFIALARAAGLEAYPVLTWAGTGNRFIADFPSALQFNHCIVRVQLPDGAIWIDATAPGYALGTLPGALSGAPGLVVADGGAHEIVTLPRPDPSANRVDAELSLEATPAGSLKGSLKTVLNGDSLAWGRELGDSGLTELSGGGLEAILASAPDRARATGLRFAGSDTGLEVGADYEVPTPLPRSGNTLLFSASRIIDDARPRAFAAAVREQPVDLGYSAETVIRLRLRVSGAITCPEPIAVESPFGRYQLRCRALTAATGQDEVVLERTLRVTQPWIEPGDYAPAREFWLAVLRGDRAAAAIEMRP